MELDRLGEVYVGKHVPAYYQHRRAAVPPHGVGDASGRPEVLGKGHVFQVYSEARAVGKMFFDNFRIKEKERGKVGKGMRLQEFDDMVYYRLISDRHHGLGKIFSQSPYPRADPPRHNDGFHVSLRNLMFSFLIILPIARQADAEASTVQGMLRCFLTAG